MNYSLIILLLSTMDKLLVRPTIYVPSYQYLCNTLNMARGLTNTYTKDPESRWIQQRINNVIDNYITIDSMLRQQTGRSSYDEAYHFRKYLIQRWIGEAKKLLSESTS